ncbi:enoyl-CoA hydratase/isomerase family protein [Tropicimonas isoalkanivorans]|uniref:enoyl-CoA hydratase/isomerase family protein n=1 Tax=Tropicimonas isoalkanivorans TaxID=441112 RepID=UPI001FE1F47E|nr:enoyl-CoA hydratase/isomerase family protein [Tropicimonas isoalkanivorans]
MIVLSQPDRLNCLSMQVWDAIGSELTDFESDTSLHSLCIRAEGKHFCTGANLVEVKSVQQNAADLNVFLRKGHEVLRRFERSRLITVAQVQGLCLAGGLELMMACDMVIAGESSKFGDQHGQFGLVPGWGGSQRLPRLVGLRRALDLFLSVRWITAAEAADWGLITKAVPDEDLKTEVEQLLSSFSTRSSRGLALMKLLAREGLDGGLDNGLEREIEEGTPVLMSEDVREGIAAFEARRSPMFKA